MKKIILFSSFCFLYFIGFNSFIPQANAFSGTGTGTTPDPYVITTCALLQEISSGLGSSYTLGNDVDCSATNPSDSNWSNSGTWADGKGFNPIGTFTGNLNGNGHVINNLFISRSGESYVGLFRFMNGGSISNIGLVSVNISGGSYTGALAGDSYSTSTISQVFSTGIVSAGGYGGGMIGLGSRLIMSNSYSTVNLTTGGYGGSLIGFLAGGSTLTNVYSAGTVTSDFGKGMIGVSSNTYFEPLLPGNVTSVSVFSDNFYDSTKGSVGTSGKGTAETTTQMQTQGTFTNWDFSTIWGINPILNLGYPYLSGVLDAAPLTPVASPNAGTFSTNQSVTLSSVGSDSIRYSTTAIPSDCSSGTLYSGAISVSISQTIYVRACDAGLNYSTNSFTYEISAPIHSRHSGTSITTRVENLKSMGKNDEAEALIKQYYFMFPVKDIDIVNQKSTPEILKIVADLKYKMENNDVKILQNFLISQNKGPYSISLKSFGANGYFGNMTKAALREWQNENGIIPATGYFGTKTKNKIKLLVF